MSFSARRGFQTKIAFWWWSEIFLAQLKVIGFIARWTTEAVTAREADSLKKGFTKDHCLSCVEVVDGEEFTKIKSHSRTCPGLQRSSVLWCMRNLSSQGTSYIHWGLSIHLRPYPLMYKNELHFLLLPRQVFTVRKCSFAYLFHAPFHCHWRHRTR